MTTKQQQSEQKAIRVTAAVNHEAQKAKMREGSSGTYVHPEETKRAEGRNISRKRS
jgi:hypothetical protein